MEWDDKKLRQKNQYYAERIWTNRRSLFAEDLGHVHKGRAYLASWQRGARKNRLVASVSAAPQKGAAKPADMEINTKSVLDKAAKTPDSIPHSQAAE